MSVYFSRLPIFDVVNNTAGYRLSFWKRRPYRNELPMGAMPDDVFIGDETFISDNYTMLFRNKKAFIKFTPELYRKRIPYSLPAKSCCVVVDIALLSDRGVLEHCFELKKQGYAIVLEDYSLAQDPDRIFSFADIVTVSVRLDKETVTKTVDKCVNANKPVLITEVDTIDEFEFARDVGASYIQGFYFAKPVVDRKQSGGPMIRTFLQILALVYCPDPDISHIAAVISTDPVLTIRLLRLINNICSDTGNTIATVHQALVLLGLDKLKEWVYLVGLQRLNRDAPSELLKTALFRASFCERLARVTPGLVGKTKEMYLLGLISIVTGTESGSVENSLSELPISDDIKKALTEGKGIYGTLFRLVYSYERGDWKEVETIAATLKIEQLNMVNQYLVSIRFVNGFSKLG